MADLMTAALPVFFHVTFFHILLIPFIYVVYNRYGRGLHSVPGPFVASLSSLWKYYGVKRGDWPTQSVHLHEKYGPMVRIGPSHISTTSTEAFDEIYLKKKGFKKTVAYELLQPQWEGDVLHNVFSVQDQTKHTALKRALGSLYSTSSVMKYEGGLDNSLVLFVRRLKETTATESKSVDMSAWLQWWAFDALGEVNFSKPLGFLEAGKDLDGICELAHEMMDYFSTWGQIPKIEKALAGLTTWTQAQKPNPLFDSTLNLVNERMKDPGDYDDMLNALIRVHRANPEKLSFRDVFGAAYINVVTAHDVLAITLRAVLYNLCRSPAAYQKLTTEVRNAAAKGDLSSPVKYTETSQLPYLMAVINETLRIHPSTGTMFERYIPQGGAMLDGKYIPAGTTIGVNAWVMNRNKTIYGSDVEVFRPERWIETPPEQLQVMRKYISTWGAGSRSCIGKNLAMMQMTKVLVELYRHFDISLADPNREWHVAGGWLTSQTNMDMTLETLSDEHLSMKSHAA